MCSEKAKKMSKNAIDYKKLCGYMKVCAARVGRETTPGRSDSDGPARSKVTQAGAKATAWGTATDGPERGLLFTLMPLVVQSKQ